MTEQQFNKATQILKNIEICKKRIEVIEKCITRTNEITNEHNITIAIQLGEKYIHTPTPEVRLKAWKNFLSSEIECLKKEIESLQDQFDEI